MAPRAIGRVLESGAAALGLALSRDQAARLEQYLALVAAWNARLRLTAARTAEEVVEVLVLPTLAVLPYLPAGGRAADLGSGAGVPGVPVAVMRPALRVVLVEASRKKAGFLEVALRELRLENAEVANARAEALGRDPEHRGRYDAVLARAVAPLRVLAEYALPLLRVGGVAVLPKGARAAAEVAAAARALRVLGGEAEVRPAPSPHAPPVVLVRKAAPTPDAYPRRPGTPERRPL